jgi:hypothetical protein
MTTETSDFPSPEARNAKPMEEDKGKGESGAAEENKCAPDPEMVSPHSPEALNRNHANASKGKDEEGDAADISPVPDEPAVNAHASHPLGKSGLTLGPEDQSENEERTAGDKKDIPDKQAIDVVKSTNNVLDCEEHSCTTAPVSQNSKSDHPRFELNISSTKPIWFEIVVEEMIINESLTSTAGPHRSVENGPIFGWKAESKLEETPPSKPGGSRQAQSWRINGNKVVWMRIGGGSPPNDHRQPQEIESRTSRRVIEEGPRTRMYDVTRVDRRYISPGNCVAITVYV